MPLSLKVSMIDFEKLVYYLIEYLKIIKKNYPKNSLEATILENIIKLEKEKKFPKSKIQASAFIKSHSKHKTQTQTQTQANSNLVNIDIYKSIEKAKFLFNYVSTHSAKTNAQLANIRKLHSILQLNENPTILELNETLMFIYKHLVYILSNIQNDEKLWFIEFGKKCYYKGATLGVVDNQINIESHAPRTSVTLMPGYTITRTRSPRDPSEVSCVISQPIRTLFVPHS